MAIKINSNIAKNIIKNIKDGEMFSIRFHRKQYVCEDCGKRFSPADTCPKCGSHKVKKTCETVAQKGVANPQHALKPGCGVRKGQSAEEAEVKNNNLKYFDPIHEVYRSCGFDKIYYLKTKGVEFEIVDTVE